MKRKPPNEYIKQHYNETIEGTTAHGSVQKGCYRVDILGETPTECHCHVDREGNELKYICFGAKCGIRGVVREGGKRSQIQKQNKDRVELDTNRRDFNLPSSFIRKLSRPCIEWLKKYSLTEDDAAEYDCGTDQSNGRLMFPILHYGERRGYTTRRVEGTLGAKWYNIVEKGTIFSIGAKTDEAIIVENPISAMKMHKLTGFTSIALLGHKITDGKLRQLNEVFKYQGVKKVFLYMDYDVPYNKLFSLKKSLTRLGVSVRIVKSNKKPRDIGEKELKEKLC